MKLKNQILIYILILSALLIGLISTASFWQGLGKGLGVLYNIKNIEPSEKKLAEGLAERQSEEDSVPLNTITDTDPDISSSAPSPLDQEMLDWVIMCESSGRHEGIWGRDGEYGLLQFKEQSFLFLSEKYGYEGDWQNRQDQINLFLLTSDEDKEIHWSCFRRYKTL
uniref:Uncharacterized protein n=1 Tax=viral metagenome TaxID=1070528 RepID=A0A6M3LWV3_9ZZZZ